jgi:hypothetical protein
VTAAPTPAEIPVATPGETRAVMKVEAAAAGTPAVIQAVTRTEKQAAKQAVMGMEIPEAGTRVGIPEVGAPVATRVATRVVILTATPVVILVVTLEAVPVATPGEKRAVTVTEIPEAVATAAIRTTVPLPPL